MNSVALATARIALLGGDGSGARLRVPQQGRTTFVTRTIMSPEDTASVDTLENLTAPELFATEASFFAITGANATVTLTSLRWDYSTQPPSLKRVVVGRIVMPITAAQSLSVGLYDYLAKAGHPAQPRTDPKQVQ